LFILFQESKQMIKTPNTGKSQEYLTDRARRMVQRYAEVSPYRLNPRQSTWEGIVRALGRQAFNLGWPYCP
jgi:ferredoxin-thioredoxin reductase catalytic subunit